MLLRNQKLINRLCVVTKLRQFRALTGFTSRSLTESSKPIHTSLSSMKDTLLNGYHQSLMREIRLRPRS